MFKQMKDMYKMQKEAKAIKAELASIHIEAEVDGVVVIVAADQELISIEIPDELATPEKKVILAKTIIKAHAKAAKKAQEVSAEKMKGLMGGMGFPGM